MPPRDERRISLAQAIYALTVIVAIPVVMVIEFGPPHLGPPRRPRALELPSPDFRHLAPPIRRPRTLEFPSPGFRPMLHGPKMDVPAFIIPPLEIQPLVR